MLPPAPRRRLRPMCHDVTHQRRRGAPVSPLPIRSSASSPSLWRPASLPHRPHLLTDVRKDAFEKRRCLAVGEKSAARDKGVFTLRHVYFRGAKFAKHGLTLRVLLPAPLLALPFGAPVRLLAAVGRFAHLRH